MRKLIMLIIALAVMITPTLVGSGSLASATQPQQSNGPCIVNGVHVDLNVGADTCVEKVESQSSSHDEDKSNVSSVNGVSIKSNVTVLSYIKASGISKQDKAHAKVYVLRESMSLWTSYYNIYGQKVWHEKFYAKGHKFYWHHGGWHDGPCDNDVVGLSAGPKKPPTEAIRIRGKVKIVQSFKFTGSSYSKVSGEAVSRSVSWANLYNQAGQQTCHSESGGYGRAIFSAVGRARFSGRVFIRIQQAIKALASGAELDLETQMGVKTKFEFIGNAYTTANGIASAESSSYASCITNISTQDLTCPEVYGPGYGGNYPDCTKDGTTTPTTPPGTPGPNPGPSDPGESYQCYSEETGEPVPANPNGTCPVGSWGA